MLLYDAWCGRCPIHESKVDGTRHCEATRTAYDTGRCYVHLGLLHGHGRALMACTEVEEAAKELAAGFIRLKHTAFDIIGGLWSNAGVRVLESLP